MKTTHLVTGAAGFIGSHVVERLLARGDSVVGLDNLNDYYDPARKRQNLIEIRRSEQGTGQFLFVEGDIRDRHCLSELFSRHAFTGIAHLAAMAGVRSSVDDPWLYYAVNLTGTLNLLEAARHANNPNFVFASTSSAYGATEVIPFVETDAADRPLAPYPASKRAAELLGHAYHHVHGVDFTALRFFTVYGPRGRPDMLAYKILDGTRTGQTVPLFGGNDMQRDWTYVGDIVSGVIAALDRRLGYEIINLGRGEPVLLSDFIRSLEAAMGKAATLISEPMPKADVVRTFANIDKARRLLDYAPAVSVAEGVEQFHAWYRSAIGDPAG